MSNSDLRADHRQMPQPDDDGSELKGILDTIAAQLTDADRRHSETLTEMQERIAGMGRQAETLRQQVPDQLAPALARIEIGVAELAQRLAVNADATPAHDARAEPAAYSPGFEPGKGEAPPAVGQQAAKPMAPPASLSGDALDPWDRESAEALTDFYESDAPSLAPQASPPGDQEPRQFAPGHHLGAESGAAHPNDRIGVDEAWLEHRFDEIAKGLDQSLAHINLDRGFYVIGQRLDQFEHQVAKLFESVASSADLASVQQIQAHVSEVVDHLVHTQDQLARLNVIEEQLVAISQKLADVHDSAAASAKRPGMAEGATAIDVAAIARATAEEMAHRLADFQSESGDSAAGVLRPLIERMMSENRQGEEHTAAILDTMQQAMIRLLDCVDSIEFAQQRNFAASSSTAVYPDNYRLAGEKQPRANSDHDCRFEPSDAGVAAVVSVKDAPIERLQTPQPVAGSTAPDVAQHNSDKRRADLVADAKRAKMRADAAAQDENVIVAPASNSAGVGIALPSPGSRPIRPSTAAAKASGPSGPSPRLIIAAVAAVLALGGLWYKLGSSGDNSTSAQPATLAPIGGSVQPQDADSIGGREAPRGTIGPRSDIIPQGGTEGQIIPGDAPAGRTTLPMLGVAVDIDQPITKSDLQQINRHQAMATISGEIGEAVARRSNALAVPASMVPTEAETEGSSPRETTLDPATRSARFARLDMPAASVGPLSLRLAAANGDPSAEFEVGARLAEGKGTAQNFKDAAKWYQQSADSGFAQAQYRLGTLYERGLGLKSDRALASAWYKRAAEQGNIKTMHNLAVLSANQTDQSPDYTTASQWFEEAAQRGLADSQFNLGVLYENGLGVNRDLKQAFMWLSLAARDGDANAVLRKGILRGKLTADETAAAERMIAAWKAKPVNRIVNDARAAGEAWKKNPKNGIAG